MDLEVQVPEHLSDILRKLGFLPSKAVSYQWHKDGGKHFEYIARYADDILVFSKYSMQVIEYHKITYHF